MLNLPMELDQLRQSPVHRFAQLWRIERADGTNFLFTDHDAPITFNYQKSLNWRQNPGTDIAGADEAYLPTDSVSTTALQKQSGMQDHNVDVQAVITSDLITEDDLRAGKYRNARVVAMVIDWRYPYAGYFTHNVFWILQATYTRETWHAQVSATPIRFRKEIGHIISHECRWDLGDSNCQKDLTSFTWTGTVTVVTDQRTFVATGQSATDHMFEEGILTWNTGNNAGVQSDVFDNVGATVQLQLNAYRPILVGDTFTIVAGCDKLKGTCVGKFNNFPRFGGFPFVPGNDAIIRGSLG